ncbi:Calvin cycle protein CP12 [Scytonema sp. NUACC26]|uniref:Calvin cycle protein CP12 n=1 Tax=Scytonema sp. NUACC26 TaxID=3140176 RepID=UPI0034DC3C72
MTKIIDANWESVKPASVISGNGNTKTIEQTILEAIEQARTACELKGNSSTECAVAWDIVEELQAEKSHRLAAHRKTALEEYCDNNPNAPECLIYDV